MRIGIDGGCLANRRGFGRFARRLVEALARESSHHRFTVFVDRPSSAAVSIPSGFDRALVDVNEAPSQAARAHGRRRWRDMFAMGRAVARSGIDVFYFPATYSFFPVWNVGSLVVTMHDTLPFVHPELVFPRLSGRIAWQLKEWTAARWADRIVTVSQASSRALHEWLGRPDPRIRVITEGPDPIFKPMLCGPACDAVLIRYGLEPANRFLLYVGGLSPHKNLPRLIEAFAQSAEADVRLVLAGDLHDVFHTDLPRIRATIARLDLLRRVILTGFVPDDDLVFLYNRAYALVQPSVLEGFGLPAVEAMACGTPVLSSRAGSLPEVVGDAGIYFDPLEVASIGGAIRTLLAEPERRDALSSVALQRSSFFTWEAAARGLLACFAELEAPLPRRRTACENSASAPRLARPGPRRLERWKTINQRGADNGRGETECLQRRRDPGQDPG
jgi:glycosyltransferase involved in cell wall biosynthesis